MAEVAGTSFCENCGKPVSAGVSFCPNCGRQLQVSAQSPPPPSAAPPSAPPRSPGKPWPTKRKIAIGAVLVLVIVAASVSGLLYFWFFPPLELKITSAVSVPSVFIGIPSFTVVYNITYTNHGVYDLAISGAIQTKIEGIREATAQAIEEKKMIQPLFLLRVGETSSWTISLGTYATGPVTPRNIRLEVTAFLTVNGMERTFTATYQFTAP